MATPGHARLWPNIGLIAVHGDSFPGRWVFQNRPRGVQGWVGTARGRFRQMRTRGLTWSTSGGTSSATAAQASPPPIAARRLP